MALIYFLGGSVGQIASVVCYPDLVSSGASQALMASCAAALLLSVPRWSKLVAIAIVVGQIALDMYVAGTIKAGHSFGFGGGLLVAGVLVLWVRFVGRGAIVVARKHEVRRPGP